MADDTLQGDLSKLDSREQAYGQEVAQVGATMREGAEADVQQADAAGAARVARAEEHAASMQPFTQEGPQDQINKVMAGAPFLFAMTALGGKASKINGMAMLEGLNGVSAGILAGNKEALDQNWKRYDAAFEKWKSNSDLQDKVFKELDDAYSSAADGTLRAHMAAHAITNDTIQMKLQVGDPATWAKVKEGMIDAHAKLMDARAKMAAASGAASALDEDSLELAATVVKADPSKMSEFASWGQSGQATRKQINARIAKDLKAAGMTPEDLVELRARSASERKTLDQQVKIYRNITSFEHVAEFNGNRLIELAKKLDDPSIPLAAAVSRLAKRAGGDVDAAEFASVMNTFQTEAARILNNPNMTGQLTEGARKDLQAVVSGNLPIAQLDRVVHRLFEEFNVRKASIQEQIKQAQTGTMPRAQSESETPNKVVNFHDLP